MIVLLDTNVIVSSLLSSKGAPAEIIRRWEAEEFEVVTSSAPLEELERAIEYSQVTRYFTKPQEQIQTFVRRFGSVATLVNPEQAIDELTADPDDNRVLECAVAGGAAYVVTGDGHLLDLGDYQGIMILKPRGFVSVLEREGLSRSDAPDVPRGS